MKWARALPVKCPKCHARAGRACRAEFGDWKGEVREQASVHQARWERWEAMTELEQAVAYAKQRA